tara:strand:+ start:391 stop:696 length:306 start_codon:yes stop_codon:yes gene_type:complete
MGYLLFDQYTLLHFSTGVIAYFWNISFPLWIIIHVLFEIIENTKLGIYFINNYITFWPGGKPKADSLINIIGDNIGGIFGWQVANYLDKLGEKYNWYRSHI